MNLTYEDNITYTSNSEIDSDLVNITYSDGNHNANTLVNIKYSSIGDVSDNNNYCDNSVNSDNRSNIEGRFLQT